MIDSYGERRFCLSLHLPEPSEPSVLGSIELMDWRIYSRKFLEPEALFQKPRP